MKNLLFISLLSVLSLNAFADTASNEFNTPIKYNYVDLGYQYGSGELDYNIADVNTSNGYLSASILPWEHVGFTAGVGYGHAKFDVSGFSAEPRAMVISAEIMPRMSIADSIDVFAAVGGSFVTVTNDDPNPETGLRSSDDETYLTYRAGINAALNDATELTIQAGSNSDESNPLFYSAEINYYISNSIAVGFNVGRVSDDYLDHFTTYGVNVRFSQNSFNG